MSPHRGAREVSSAAGTSRLLRRRLWDALLTPATHRLREAQGQCHMVVPALSGHTSDGALWSRVPQCIKLGKGAANEVVDAVWAAALQSPSGGQRRPKERPARRVERHARRRAKPERGVSILGPVVHSPGLARERTETPRRDRAELLLDRLEVDGSRTGRNYRIARAMHFLVVCA
jgi:hypothetical protein